MLNNENPPVRSTTNFVRGFTLLTTKADFRIRNGGDQLRTSCGVFTHTISNNKNSPAQSSMKPVSEAKPMWGKRNLGGWIFFIVLSVIIIKLAWMGLGPDILLNYNWIMILISLGAIFSWGWQLGLIIKEPVRFYRDRVRLQSRYMFRPKTIFLSDAEEIKFSCGYFHLKYKIHYFTCEVSLNGKTVKSLENFNPKSFLEFIEKVTPILQKKSFRLYAGEKDCTHKEYIFSRI